MVSPHLDDAVYSTWRYLTSSQSVSILTVLAGVPPEGTPLSQYDRLTRSREPRNRMEIRRAEDASVCGRHGWLYVHLDFLDAPYRAGPLDEDSVAAALAERLPPSDVVLVPAGIGMHPDHVAVRDIALLSVGPTKEVHVYADLPYATRYGWPSWVTGTDGPRFLDVDAFYEPALRPLLPRLDAPVVHMLDEATRRSKLRALRAYATQFDALEGGPTRGLTHPDRLRYEVTWRVS